MIKEVLVIPDNLPRLLFVEAREDRLLTRLHIHRESEILQITKGTLDVYVDSFTERLMPGDYVIFNGNIPHSTYASSDAAYMNLQFDFHGIFDREDAEELLEPNSYIPYLKSHLFIKKDSSYYPEFNAIFSGLSEHHKLKEEYPEYFKGDLYFIYDFMASAGLFASVSDTLSASGLDKIKRIAGYINSHYNENITLEILSEHFDLNPSYLCRCFKKFTNYTIIEYINYVRIKIAERKLINTDESVSEIAKSVGFPSQSYFTKTFRAMLSITPLQYKKMKKRKLGEYNENFFYIFGEKGDIR